MLNIIKYRKNSDWGFEIITCSKKDIKKDIEDFFKKDIIKDKYKLNKLKNIDIIEIEILNKKNDSLSILVQFAITVI